MLAATLRRGAAAGLFAGVLAGFVGFAAGTPSLEAATALEARAGPVDAAGHDADGAAAFPRPVQRLGLVVGTALLGCVVGLAFAVAFLWSATRAPAAWTSSWRRSLSLGAMAVGALVLLPAVAYPPNPPGVGDPATVGLRTSLYLGTVVIGLLLAVAARVASRQLAHAGMAAASRQTAVATGALVVAAGWLALRPPLPGARPGLPPELLWDFRLAAIATQLALYGGTAVVFGLLTGRSERATSAATGPPATTAPR